MDPAIGSMLFQEHFPDQNKLHDYQAQCRGDDHGQLGRQLEGGIELRQPEGFGYSGDDRRAGKVYMVPVEQQTGRHYEHKAH